MGAVFGVADGGEQVGKGAGALPDHAPLKRLPPLPPQEAALPLLCTEKDAAKLWPHAPQALAVPLRLQAPAAFFDALDALLPPPPGNQMEARPDAALPQSPLSPP